MDEVLVAPAAAGQTGAHQVLLLVKQALRNCWQLMAAANTSCQLPWR
jgi:hypothetical protein